jgi:RND family efflux transporter MFP subunit
MTFALFPNSALSFNRCCVFPTLLTIIWLAFGSIASTSTHAEVTESFTEPYLHIDLALPEAGILSDVRGAVGDAVSQRQFIAALDHDVLLRGLAIAQARAVSTGAVEAARAELRLRHDRLMQLRELQDRGSASHHEVTRAETDARIADSRLQMAEDEQRLLRLEVDRMKAQIERRIIRSPIDGVISEIHKEVGESYLASDPRIVTVVQLQKLKAKFSVSPGEAAKVNVGDTARVTFPDTTQSVVAQVANIAPVIDAKSGTVEVTLVIDNRRMEFRGGARCLWELGADSPESTTRNADQKTQPNIE